MFFLIIEKHLSFLQILIRFLISLKHNLRSFTYLFFYLWIYLAREDFMSHGLFCCFWMVGIIHNDHSLLYIV